MHPPTIHAISIVTIMIMVAYLLSASFCPSINVKIESHPWKVVSELFIQADWLDVQMYSRYM